MPKPVLSDSLFNADDVATAILSEANLQVTNNDLGVVDRSSLFVIDNSNGTISDVKAYSFNGFMFAQAFLNFSGYTPGNEDVLAEITDSNFHPSYEVIFSGNSYQGDSSTYGKIKTNGKIIVVYPVNAGDSTWRMVMNCWYRFA